MAQKKEKPVHEIRLGRIRGTAWANRYEDGSVKYNYVIARLYKDGDVWRDSTSFPADQLPLVAKVSDMLLAWDLAQKSAPSSADEGDE